MKATITVQYTVENIEDEQDLEVVAQTLAAAGVEGSSPSRNAQIENILVVSYTSQEYTISGGRLTQQERPNK